MISLQVLWRTAAVNGSVSADEELITGADGRSLCRSLRQRG